METWKSRCCLIFTIFLSASRNENGIVQRVENITKSTQDARFYRFLRLRNDLQILLLSDSSTDVSSVNVDVSTGNVPTYQRISNMRINLTTFSCIREIQKNIIFKRHTLFTRFTRFSSFFGAYAIHGEW